MTGPGATVQGTATGSTKVFGSDASLPAPPPGPTRCGTAYGPHRHGFGEGARHRRPSRCTRRKSRVKRSALGHRQDRAGSPRVKRPRSGTRATWSAAGRPRRVGCSRPASRSARSLGQKSIVGHGQYGDIRRGPPPSGSCDDVGLATSRRSGRRGTRRGGRAGRPLLRPRLAARAVLGFGGQRGRRLHRPRWRRRRRAATRTGQAGAADKVFPAAGFSLDYAQREPGSCAA